MNKIALVIPAVLVVVGVSLLVLGYGATGEFVSVVGLEMQPRFVMLFGAIALLAAAAITAEVLGKAKRHARSPGELPRHG